MSVRSLSLSLAISCAILYPLAAQDRVRRDPEALQVLAGSFARMVGKGGLPADVVVEGKVLFADGLQGDVRIEAKGEKQLRNQLQLIGKTTLAIFGAGKGRRVKDGRSADLPLWATAYPSLDVIPALSRLREFQRGETNIAYEGVEKEDGVDVYHIRLWSVARDGRTADIEELMSEYHLFVDVESMLMVRTRTFIFSPEIIENRSPVDFYFNDYRQVGDVLVPHHIRRYVSEQLDSQWTVEKVQFNVGLSDNLFQ